MKKLSVALLLSLSACDVAPVGPSDAPENASPTNSSETAPSGAVMQVSVQGTQSLASYESMRFNALVEGTGNFSPGVTWTLESGGGTLSDIQGQTIQYTAPLVSTVTPVTLRATSQMDPSKSSVHTFNITPPFPAAEFLAGNYAGTEYKSSQKGNEFESYDPPIDVMEETAKRTYKLARESDTQIRISFFDGFLPEQIVADLHPDGTLTLADQGTGYLPQGRCTLNFSIITGAQTGSGTWDREGNLSLRWSSRATNVCYYSTPEGPAPTSYRYREHRVTAVKDPNAPFPW